VFGKLNHRNREIKKPRKAPTESDPKARTRLEGWDRASQVEEGGKEKTRYRVSRE
jgi:hypothetical protein